MPRTNFDYKAARNAGYSDEEITGHLTELHPDFDYKAAEESGYSPKEINEHLSNYKPEKSALEKGSRLAGQYALGAAESALLPYELGAAHLAQPEAQEVAYRQQLFENIEDLQQRKELSPSEWSQQDEEQLLNLVDQAKNPEKSKEFIQTGDIGVRGIAEKVTGQDLHPEGIAEKAVSWMGFIKNPTNIKELSKSGVGLKDVVKAISPSGSDVLRGIGAGSALQLAENGNYGPIGTMAAAVIGDIAGGGVAGAIKEAGKFAKGPKQYLAGKSKKLIPKEKLASQKELINDFREAGLQADLGTLTDSNLAKWTQSRLSQSGLTGKALEDLRKQVTSQITNEYENIAKSLGEYKNASTHEMGTVVKESIQKIRDSDLNETRNLYKKASEALEKEKSPFVKSDNLAMKLAELKKDLQPGALKSSEQNIVLEAIKTLERDIYDSERNLMQANVKDLMNNKIALNDMVNYEAQGGAKQLLKGIVSEIDRSIISHGEKNPRFAKNYVEANKKFSEHAKTFRNKDINRLLNSQNPEQIMNKMNTVQGVRDLQKLLQKSKEGKDLFDNIRRHKLEEIIGKNLVDSTTQQAKLGTFSKLLQKGKNKELIREILGPENFKRLERLQKNSGKLAESVDKFYNASKSGTVAVDAAIIAKAMTDVVSLLSGNPWPLFKTTGGVFTARKLSNLLADPEFLKLAEEAILASEKNDTNMIIKSYGKIKPYIFSALKTSNENAQYPSIEQEQR